MKDFLALASNWVVPLLLLGIPLYAYAFRKVNVYESFIDGAKEGFWIGVKIIPYLVAILVAIGMFRASGAMHLLVTLLKPLTVWTGFPAEALPVALLRPLSGSGTLGLISDIFNTLGPDGFVGKLVSVIEGSTETTFYVLAIYFGSIAIRKTRHALPASLLGDLTGVVAAFIVCSLLF
ncbi:spore maturation protein [bacterium]|nr:spore maturation protein [bacterium]